MSNFCSNIAHPSLNRHGIVAWSQQGSHNTMCFVYRLLLSRSPYNNNSLYKNRVSHVSCLVVLFPSFSFLPSPRFSVIYFIYFLFLISVRFHFKLKSSSTRRM